MGSRIIQAVMGGRKQRGDTAAHQDGHRGRKADQHSHLHLKGFYLFAQVLRRTPHHQPRYKHCKDGKPQHTVEPAARTAEYHLSQLHQQHRNKSAKRRVAVVHGIDRAVGSSRGKYSPCPGCGYAKSGFLTFHITACLSLSPHIDCAVLGYLGGAGLFTAAHNGQRCRQHDEHGQEHRHALSLVLHIPAKGKAQARRYEKQGNHFK